MLYACSWFCAFENYPVTAASLHGAQLARGVSEVILIAVLTSGRAEEADWKVVSLRNNSGVPKCISRIVSLRFSSWAACHFSSGV